MAYLTGSLIEASDYNTLATTFRTQWGTGIGDHGIGQNVSAVSNVAAETQVTATQWTGLIQNINSGLAHEGQALVPVNSVITGSPVTCFNALVDAVDTVVANSGITGLSLVDSAANVLSYNSSWGTGASSTVTFTQTLTFASGDAARYFFNAGGKIKLSFSRTGGTANLINASWSSLCAACGVVSIGYKNTSKSGGSGNPTLMLNSNNGGYWNTTDSNSVHFLQYDSSPGYYYANDYVKLSVKHSGIVLNDGVSTLVITTQFHNGSSTQVNGTLNTSLVVSAPSSTYIANTWGDPSYSGVVA